MALGVTSSQVAPPPGSPASYSAAASGAGQQVGAIGGANQALALSSPGPAAAAGQAAGNYLSALAPSLAGLFSAAGLNNSSFSNSFLSGGAGTPAPTSVTPTTAATAQPVNTAAATQAAFDQAHDTAGAQAAAALATLRGQMGATGQLGGGAEAQAVQNQIAANEGAIGEAVNEQAITNAGMSQQTALANQNAQQQTNLANAGAANAVGLANASNALAARQQNIQAQEAAASLGLSQQSLAQQKSLAMLQAALNASTMAGSATSALY